MSAQNLRLLSLEYLWLKIHNVNELIGIILLCRNVSATLTTLKISAAYATFNRDNLYQLCGLPFPNLHKLGFAFVTQEYVLSTVGVLTQRAEECVNVKSHFLPSLAALTLSLRGCYEMEPHCLLGLLDKWRVGEASDFRLEFRGDKLGPRDWPSELREEFRSIVGSCQIEVTWDECKARRLIRRGQRRLMYNIRVRGRKSA